MGEVHYPDISEQMGEQQSLGHILFEGRRMNNQGFSHEYFTITQAATQPNILLVNFYGQFLFTFRLETQHKALGWWYNGGLFVKRKCEYDFIYYFQKLCYYGTEIIGVTQN